MTVETIIDSEAGYITHEVTGVLTCKDIIDALSSRLTDSQYRPGMNVLWKSNKCEKISLSRKDIQNIADHVASNEALNMGYKVAIVGSSDLEYGLGRMYQSLAELSIVEIKVFRSIDDAYQWILQG
jgi:hypothetical protein